MKIPSKTWQKYIKKLSKINVTAASDVVTYMINHDVSTYEGTKALIDYAYAVSTKYGEAAAELSCQMYDAIATVSKVSVPAAEPAATATYGEIAKTIYGTMASTKNPDAIGAAVGRSVKLASVDTLQKNALRDGAEWAWIPAGDTCPYCLMLASRGWVKASKKALKNGHADHIHNNCDCTYCVRFDSETTVEGYDPDALYEQYKNAGDTPRERLNAMRRQHYAANKDYINAQKRDAYAKRMERNSSAAEEFIPKNKNGTSISFDEKIIQDPKFGQSRSLISKLSNEYNTRLERVTVGAEKAAGDVDITGSRMRLNAKQVSITVHEFAHTLANSKAEKYSLTDDKAFWKEIRKIYRAYHKDVDAVQDVRRWISSYEHSSRNIDEFMAEAFTHAKLAELGLEIPSRYGTDFTYSRQVLATINKYFKR